MKVFLDLESLPPEKDDPVMGDRVGRMTDEEYRRLALDGEYGRVLCIGLIVEEGDQIVHRGVLGRDRSTLQFHLDERRTLRAFWKLLGRFDPNRDLLIGCNLLDFDLHFLYRNCRGHHRQRRASLNRGGERFAIKSTLDESFSKLLEQPVLTAQVARLLVILTAVRIGSVAQSNLL